VLSRFFSLLPLWTAALSTMASEKSRLNEKSRLRSWKLEPNPTVIGGEPTERKTELETTESTTIRL
jgi:hypothetical protein